MRRPCSRCGAELELELLDPRGTVRLLLCEACAKGRRQEGEPGEGEEDGAVAMDELGADGAVVSGKVRF